MIEVFVSDDWSCWAGNDWIVAMSIGLFFTENSVYHYGEVYARPLKEFLKIFLQKKEEKFFQWRSNYCFRISLKIAYEDIFLSEILLPTNKDKKKISIETSHQFCKFLRNSSHWKDNWHLLLPEIVPRWCSYRLLDQQNKKKDD